ncbi:MAG: hypothetical protein E5X49_22995 [Mesorhizobium sp.]|uniref:hypothetical protein n=1 Tax=Mesorhizobium sp. TaxID=1871066 RepID=UPI001227BCAE|nr:hypothetical protein [Mesorhizobium sp.]TIQ40493.1 MAG: hypothetical protein E5X49_22995 [Mesorhizobium sp.]
MHFAQKCAAVLGERHASKEIEARRLNIFRRDALWSSFQQKCEALRLDDFAVALPSGIASKQGGGGDIAKRHSIWSQFRLESRQFCGG